jgi:MSHA biogenesis protein MshM
MYLEHFEIKEQPFNLTPNTQYYCGLLTHESALNVLLVGLQNGEGFIKVTGEVGSGKTLVCRKLLNTLTNPFVTAYIPSPDLTPVELRFAIAKELGIKLIKSDNEARLREKLNHKLLEMNAAGKQVVLIVDEAQALSDECLEAVRLLTNLETESEKLMHIVLFGQPELDEKLNTHQFRQLKQRITFSFEITPLSKNDLDAYVFHRLSIAGYRKGPLFSATALNLLYQHSGGTPRIINVLCHKAMMAAYGQGEHTITKQAMKSAIEDTKTGSPKPKGSAHYLWGAIVLLLGVTSFLVVQKLIG